MNRINQSNCARIPTAEGHFQLCIYYDEPADKEHLALILGDVAGQEHVLTRLHSECFTGDVLGSLRCDCGPQLRRAMELISQAGRGIVLYLRQEGRGIGLRDKLRAYNLQDQGYDTVEANLMLGHQADARDYGAAAVMLQDLGAKSIRLMTNNPDKIESLQRLGIAVSQRVALETAVHQENYAYLQTKVNRMRHLLDLETAVAAFVPPVSSSRPFVTLSYAQSIDGSISRRRGEPLAISGPESLQFTHQLRANHAAILVGIGAVLADDPRLTVRLVPGQNPQPVILDSRLRFPLTARLLTSDHRPWIMTTAAAPREREAALQAAGARVIRLPADRQGRVSLPDVLDHLGQQQIRSLMVEGGAEVISSFLNERLANQLIVTVAPLLVGGLHAVNGLGGAGSMTLPQLRNAQYQQLGADLILSAGLSWETA
jgi:3,4-dihydroxy 2-butanone 4-phosphate synthase/GTP cyclohydrolase II